MVYCLINQARVPYWENIGPRSWQYGPSAAKSVQKRPGADILPVRSPSSENQGLLAGTMRYFRAKVYFKSWRAPGNLFLPNQFQKWSNSVPLIGQKKKYFSAQSGGTSSRLTLPPYYTTQFSSSRLTKLLGRYNGKIVVESFRKKYSTKPRKSQALTWG